MSNFLFGTLLFLVGLAVFVNWCFRKGYIGIYVDFRTLAEKLEENFIFAMLISGLLILVQTLLTEFL